MTEDERALGRLEAQMEGLETRMENLEAQVTEIRQDVHELSEGFAEVRSNVKLLLERDQSLARPLAIGVLVFAAAGLYYNRLSEWAAVVLVFVAGVLSQHGNLNRLAATVFRRKEESRAESPTP